MELLVQSTAVRRPSVEQSRPEMTRRGSLESKEEKKEEDVEIDIMGKGRGRGRGRPGQPRQQGIL